MNKRLVIVFSFLTRVINEEKISNCFQFLSKGIALYNLYKEKIRLLNKGY